MNITLKQAMKIVAKHNKENEKRTKLELSKWIDTKIGKVFVYRNNSYSDDSLKWNVYKIVLKKVDYNKALIEEWQLIDPKTEHYEIKRSIDYIYDWNIDNKDTYNNWPECSKDEFFATVNKITGLLETEFVKICEKRKT